MSTPALSVIINGKEEKVLPGTTIKALLELKAINPNVVACELNLKIIKRSELDKTVLKENDQLEIIQMIGGG